MLASAAVFGTPGKLVLVVGLACALVGCGKHEQRFESTCQLVRRDVVETNAKGETEIMDIELEWDPCPGDQFQVVRGGKEFAACMQKYELGKLLPVLVKHWWDDRGYYVWDVYKVGDCARAIESDSEGSFEKSQECSDNIMFGSGYGLYVQPAPVQGPRRDLPVDGAAVSRRERNFCSSPHGAGSHGGNTSSMNACRSAPPKLSSTRAIHHPHLEATGHQGGGSPQHTRVSAVMSVEPRWQYRDQGSELRNSVVVMHNPFAAVPIGAALFGDVSQWVRHGDITRWKNDYQGP